MPKLSLVLSLILVAVLTASCSRRNSSNTTSTAPAATQAASANGWWVAEDSYLMGIGRTFQLYELGSAQQCNGTEQAATSDSRRVYVSANGNCWSRHFDYQVRGNTLTTTDLLLHSGSRLATTTWRRISFSQANAIFNAYSVRHRARPSQPRVDFAGAATANGMRANAALVTRRFDDFDWHKAHYYLKLKPNRLTLAQVAADDFDYTTKVWPGLLNRVLFQENRVVDRAKNLRVGHYCAIAMSANHWAKPKYISGGEFILPRDGATYDLHYTKDLATKVMTPGGVGMYVHDISLSDVEHFSDGTNQFLSLNCVKWTNDLFSGDVMDALGDFADIYRAPY